MSSPRIWGGRHVLERVAHQHLVDGIGPELVRHLDQVGPEPGSAGQVDGQIVIVIREPSKVDLGTDPSLDPRSVPQVGGACLWEAPSQTGGA